MTQRMIEIRWHGRGGQGAKTAAQLVAQVALEEGKHSQGFPEYGPERMGAPVRGFTRISDHEIRVHCPIHRPDAVVVLDDTLVTLPVVTEGTKAGTIFVVNTRLTPAQMREHLGVEGAKVYCLNATEISLVEMGRPMPNTPMIGGLIRATECISMDALKLDIRKKFQSKLGEQVVQGNLRSVERAYEEVRWE